MKLKISFYLVGIITGIFLILSGCGDDGNPPVCTMGDAAAGANQLETRIVCADLGTTQYTLQYMTNWSVACNGTMYLGKSRMPPAAHLTDLAGATHNPDYTMWAVGGMASVGVEMVAELGKTGMLETEVMAQINANPPTADQFITTNEKEFIDPVETVTITFPADGNFPELSLMSMVAPSPDWFVGLSRVSLVNDDCTWKDTITHPLRVYDAGTEEDRFPFSLGNDPESPHKPISRFAGGPTIGFEESKNQHIIGQVVLTRVP